jgi:hypothetical protein
VSELKKILYGELGKNISEFRPITEPSDFNIMTLGCSNAYGQGLKDEEVFDFIIKQEIEKDYNIKVSNWNLAQAGKDSDFVKIIFNEYAKKLKPDLTIIWWPNFCRRFMFDKLENKFSTSLPSGRSDFNKFYLKYVSSDEQDIYNWYYNCYLFVEHLSQILDIDILHIAPDAFLYEAFDNHKLNIDEFLSGNLYMSGVERNVEGINFNWNERVGLFYQVDDVSETDYHRGRESHKLSGKGIYKFLKSNGYFKKLENE